MKVSIDDFKSMPEHVRRLVVDWARQPDLEGCRVRDIEFTSDDRTSGVLTVIARDESGHAYLRPDRQDVVTEQVRRHWAIPYPEEAVPFFSD